MANQFENPTPFGLNRTEGELLVCRLIQATVPPDRMHDHELANLSASMRVICDRVPDFVQRYPLLLAFWDRIELEIALRSQNDDPPSEPEQLGEVAA